MSVALQSSELAEFNARQLVADHINPRLSEGEVGLEYSHKRAGTIAVQSFSMPHMQVVDLNWKTGEESILLKGNTVAERTVAVSFQLSGSMFTRFAGIRSALNMQQATHNLVFIPQAGDEHRMPGNARVHALQINLDLEFFKASIGCANKWSEQVQHNLYHGIPFAAGETSFSVTPAMRQVIQTLHSLPDTPMRQLLFQSKVLELLAMQFDQFAPASSSTVSDDEAHQFYLLKQFLDDHFLEQFSLSDLCRQFFLNEFKLKRGFKQLYGTTVFGHLRRLRMEHALQCLRNRNVSVDQVAAELGYDHPQHFSTAFKKHFGYAPSFFTGRRSR